MPTSDWYTIIQEKENRLKPLVERAMEIALKGEVDSLPRVSARFFYGAIGIDPKHLVVWYIFKTDREKKLSESSGQMKRLAAATLQFLAAFGYPCEHVGPDRICFASEEEIEKGGGYRAFFQ